MKQLFAGTKPKWPKIEGRLYNERRAQNRWLQHVHPEAAIAVDSYDQQLAHDIKKFKFSDDVSMEKPLFTFGEITDDTNETEPTPLPVIAVASGKSGELLSIVRAPASTWQWGDSDDACLVQPAVDPNIEDDSTIWTNSALPITQIKFASGDSKRGKLRWFFIQRQNSTTILQPQYLLQPSRTNDFMDETPPSLVDAAPLVTLSQRQTTHNAHSDVILGSNSEHVEPWIAFIDECGYWGIWTVEYREEGLAAKNAKLRRNACGHMSDGLLDFFPKKQRHIAQRHGLLMVNEEMPEIVDEGQEPTRSLLVMWNRERISAFDTTWRRVVGGSRPLWKAAPGAAILDIQSSPVNERHLFILTLAGVVWVEVEFQDRMVVINTLMSRSHHSWQIPDAKMTISPATFDRNDTALVSIMSPSLQQLHTYWFTQSRHSGMLRWHQSVSSIPGTAGLKPLSIYSLNVLPLELIVTGRDGSTEKGTKYAEEGVRFYQVNMVTDDLTLTYCTCVSSPNPTLEIEIPQTRISWTAEEKSKKWLQLRKEALHELMDEFVVEDDFDGFDIFNEFGPDILSEGDEERLLAQPESERKRTVRKVNFTRLGDRLLESLFDSINQGEVGIPFELFNTAMKMISDGRSSGHLPLLSFQQIHKELNGALECGLPTEGMEDLITKLYDETDENVVVTQLRQYTADEPGDILLIMPYIYQKFINYWISPLDNILSNELQTIRQIWACELAKDIFLSSYGIMIQDTPVLGPQATQDVEMSHSQPMLPSSQPTLPNSSQTAPPSSPIPSRASSRSPQPETDDAINRLRLLAVSVKHNPELSKPASVLSFWPTQRGVDTANYVSSVTLASEDKFKTVREKKQQREAKRKSQIDKFRRQSIMRAGEGQFGTSESPIPFTSGGSHMPFRGSPFRPMQPGGVGTPMAPGSSMATPVRHKGTPMRPEGTPMRPEKATPGLPLIQQQQQYTMSSQMQVPNSSQTQGFGTPTVTMSQPVAGAFGERKKAKKGKRKSGF